jgi:hypothetical protein
MKMSWRKSVNRFYFESLLINKLVLKENGGFFRRKLTREVRERVVGEIQVEKHRKIAGK